MTHVGERGYVTLSLPFREIIRSIFFLMFVGVCRRRLMLFCKFTALGADRFSVKLQKPN